MPQYFNAAMLQYFNASILQYSNTPILQYCNDFRLFLPGIPCSFASNYIILRRLLYYSWSVFFFSIALRKLSRSRNNIFTIHFFKFTTLVSSGNHSKISTQCVSSWMVLANSQRWQLFCDNVHFSAKIIDAPRKENMENMENISLSLLYKLVSSYSLYILLGEFEILHILHFLLSPTPRNYPIQYAFYDIGHVQS